MVVEFIENGIEAEKAKTAGVFRIWRSAFAMPAIPMKSSGWANGWGVWSLAADA
jgi:hypothetical protein